MGTYAVTADIQARNPYRTIGASSKPTATEVSTWIDDAEGVLHGILAEAQVPTPITNANGISLMKSWVVEYVSGLVRQAYAAAGGDGGNDDGQDQIDKFWERTEALMNNPARASAMLAGGEAADSSRRFRSYQLDNIDDKSIGNDDFTPTFTKSDGGDQF